MPIACQAWTSARIMFGPRTGNRLGAIPWRSTATMLLAIRRKVDLHGY